MIGLRLPKRMEHEKAPQLKRDTNLAATGSQPERSEALVFTPSGAEEDSAGNRGREARLYGRHHSDLWARSGS